MTERDIRNLEPISFHLIPAVKAEGIAAYLSRHGVRVVGKPTEANDVEDGQIVISDTIHVQVGAGYALVNEISHDDDGNLKIKFGKTRYDGRDILRDIQAMIPKA